MQRTVFVVLLQAAFGAGMSRVNPTSRKYQLTEEFGPDKEKEWAYPEHQDGWMHAHNSLRHEISDMKAVLAKLKGRKLEAWEVASITAWWKSHLVCIHAHHKNEDDIFTPFLSTRIKYPDKLTTAHVALVEMLDEMDAYIMGGFETASTLRAKWSKYESFMKPHLREEELVGLPLARAYFTPAEIAPKVQEIIAKEPPIGMGSFIRTMGGEAGIKAFMAQEGIPFFVWHIQFKGAYNKYLNEVYVHIEALLSGMPPPPPPTDFTPLLAIAAVCGVAALIKKRSKAKAKSA